MISFIVIGRNEGHLLKKCLQSIYNETKLAGVNTFEIIYVDSNSEDASIDLAMQFEGVRVFKIYKDYSPAAGRNLGAEVAKGEILFFIDGDMQIHSEFLNAALDDNKNLKYPYCSGNCWYQCFDAKNIFIREGYYFSIREKPYKSTKINGIFVVEKKLWQKIGGMDERFPIPGGEDHDLYIRLRNNGIPFYRLPQRIATVHIYDYTNFSIIWRKFFKGNTLYGRSFLYRKNILRWPVYRLLSNNEKSLLLLIISFAIFLISNFAYIFIIYILFITYKSLKNGYTPISNYLSLIPYYIFRDITVLFGFIFLFPKKRNKQYICIR